MVLVQLFENVWIVKWVTILLFFYLIIIYYFTSNWIEFTSFHFLFLIFHTNHTSKGSEMETLTRRISQTAFFLKVSRSVAVLCMPGLGYDTYRLSETLLLGWDLFSSILFFFIHFFHIYKFNSSMPVIERGVGLDRTVYKLPVSFLSFFPTLQSISISPSFYFISFLFYFDLIELL